MNWSRRDVLIGIGATSVTFPSSVVHAKQSEEKRRTLEQFLHRDYKDTWERARRNNEYVINQVYLRDDVYELCKNPEQAKKRIITHLQGIEHVYRDSSMLPSRKIELPYPKKRSCVCKNPGVDRRWISYTYTETPEEVDILTPRQLVRVHLFLDALQNTPLSRELGNIAERDVKNKFSEEGGLLTYTQRVRAEGIASRYEKEGEAVYNGVYAIPRRDILLKPHLGEFHLHANQEDNTLIAGPSIFDIKHSFGEAYKYEESHHLVVTKLKGRKINVDFLSAEFDEDITLALIDLGNYSY